MGMPASGDSRTPRRWRERIKPTALFIPWELVWFVYIGTTLFALRLIARSRRIGVVPKHACVFCATHVGGFDPLFVVLQSRRWRMKALFTGDERYPFVRFLFQAVWRFRVSQDPERKAVLNPQTLAAAVRYLERGGSVMVFPEGHRFWERKLYPGVAQIAHRSGVPIVPVGLENAYVYRVGAEHDPLLRAVRRIVRETHRRGCVGVRFGKPILPDPSLSEAEDVDRMMRAIERWFGEFYLTCYRLPGSTWCPNPPLRL